MANERNRVERRLAAIFAADVAGYSRLMRQDELGTLRALTAHREIMDRLIAGHGGRIANTAGDSVLAEFPSAVDAVRCAAQVQDALASVNHDKPEEARLLFRIGIHVGDVMVSGGDLLGDGVNIAARLEGIAEPGGICLSEAAYGYVRRALPLTFTDLGPQQVKNIEEPVRAYALKALSPAPAGKEQVKSLPLPDKPSIVVLPFTNISGDPEQEFFADGVVEDIITALSRVRCVFVIARNSSFVFKGKAVGVKEVGQQLGVRYVLEGSVRKAASRMRITAQLVEAATGANIWAERYDRNLTDIFAVQDELVQQVVAAIEPSVMCAEIGRARSKLPASLDAYDLYLQALPEFHSFTQAGFQHAQTLLEDALQRAPQFSEAWAALADCTARMAIAGWIADWDHASEKGCHAARRAIEADPSNGTSLAIAAFTLANLGGKLDEAVDLADNALRLHPNSATVCTNCGWVFVLNGDYDKALTLLEAARRMSPLDPRGYLMNNAATAAYLFSGRLEEAERWTRRTLDTWPWHPVSLRYRAAVLMLLGRCDEAQAVIPELLRIQPNSSVGRLRRSHYRDTEMAERYYAALRQAGVPE